MARVIRVTRAISDIYVTSGNSVGFGVACSNSELNLRILGLSRLRNWAATQTHLDALDIYIFETSILYLYYYPYNNARKYLDAWHFPVAEFIS